MDELFAEFEREPLASASVAQVHAATLQGGQRVVIKVIRPGIEKTIRQDLGLLFWLAKVATHAHPDGRRLRAQEVVTDYEVTVLDELDLRREAASTAQLRRNFVESDELYVPEVYWDYTSTNVFVMERIHGVPVSDVTALRAAGTDMKELAERGVRIFFTQVFRDSFFHADMHPGNIFVDTTDPAKPRYIAIDCAIMGSLSDFDQYYLARNLVAMFNRDYREVAELHIECGWVPVTTELRDFEAAIRSVCEPVFEKPLGEISFGSLLLYLFQTARRFDMEVQPSLVLLQKTLLHIEGLGRQLYPELDLWSTAKPFLEDWLQQRYSPAGIAAKLQKIAPSLLEQIPQNPAALLDAWQRGTPALSGSERPLQQKIEQLESRLAATKRRQRVLLVTVVSVAMIIVLNRADMLFSPAAWHPASWLFVAILMLMAIRR